LIAGLRRHHKLADLLQAAGLARSTFYYQRQAILRAGRHSDMETKIRAVYDKHKGR
jgi:putative transposase